MIDDDFFLHDIYILLQNLTEASGGSEVERHRHGLVDLPGHRQVHHGRHKTIIFVISSL